MVAWTLAVSALAASPSAAQFGPPDTTTGPPKAATTFGLGIQVLDVSAFNRALAVGGFPEMSENVFSTGLATEIRFGRWDLAFSGSGISGSATKTAAWRTRTGGSALTFGGGVALVDGATWRITSMGGIGLTRITYHIEQVRGGTVDSVIADPLRATDLSGQSWIWQAGLGVERKLGKAFGRKLGIALRAGYARAFGEPDWRTDDNDLSSGPRASYGGMYARIGMTFGVPKRQDVMIPALVSVIPWLSR
ncbi:MAG TPA: hypothetical protein VG940_13165 [Gemmatimonadales bacterium]|nr:hypothetical protein [Gemmatimonadales bacterium]